MTSRVGCFYDNTIDFTMSLMTAPNQLCDFPLNNLFGDVKTDIEGATSDISEIKCDSVMFLFQHNGLGDVTHDI